MDIESTIGDVSADAISEATMITIPPEMLLYGRLFRSGSALWALWLSIRSTLHRPVHMIPKKTG